MVIAVSEGIVDESGDYYSNMECLAGHDEFGHAQLSGSAKVVENILKKEFGRKTRSIELNVTQRCASHFASLTDLNDSVDIGKAGAEAALSGASGVVMGYSRNDDNTFSIVQNKVSDVANLEKKVPDNFIAENGCDVTQEFIDYCLPLIIGEPEIVTENGIPKHISLKLK